MTERERFEECNVDACLSSFTHDAAAALLEDGAIQAAVEDSKLVRSSTNGLPETAMRYCLAKVGSAGMIWTWWRWRVVRSRDVCGINAADAAFCFSPFS